MKQILIILIILPVTVFSQSKTDKSYSSWNSVILNHTISNKFYVKNEVHFRRTNFLKDWQQLLIRPSVHYIPNEFLDFSIGYSFAKNYRQFYNFNENNVWEQVQLSHTIGKLIIKHRFRFEQRFIDQILQDANSNLTKNGIDFNMRVRYRFTWGIPLLKITNHKKINISVFDEIWLNTNSGVVPKSLNQNWFYIGLSYPILKNTSLGFGYKNDHAPIGVNHFRSNNILQTTLKYHIK